MTDESDSTPPGENQSQIVLALSQIEGEPRIRDIDLAARLGFERARKIRELIAPHRGALSQMGEIPEIEEVVGKGQRTKAYYLNRKQAIFITAKSETPAATDITIEIIERFDAYERGEGSDAALLRKLNDPTTVRGLLANFSERIIALEASNAELAPKAEALDRIAVADGSLNVTEAAKALQMRPKDLFTYLLQHNWIYKRPGGQSYLGYQARVQSGDLEHKVTTVLRGDGSEKVVEQVRITPKGLTKLAKLNPPLLREVA